MYRDFNVRIKVCDRCGKTIDGKSIYPDDIPDDIWGNIDKDTDLCPECSVSFVKWWNWNETNYAQ